MLIFLISFLAGRAWSDQISTTINSSKGGILKANYSKDWKIIDDGIDYNEVIVTSGQSYMRTVLKFVRLDPVRINTKILVPDKIGSQNGFFTRSLAKLTGAALIINGSYFDENRRPLGFLVSDSKIINKRIVTNWLYSGVFYVKKGKPFLSDRKDYPKGAEVEQALQAGPHLIANGRAIREIKNPHASHFRSGIGLTGDNKIIVFATDTKYSGVSWHELQQILILPVLHCVHAMNLDGGGSTQMALVTEEKKEFIDGISKVPVAIGFFKK